MATLSNVHSARELRGNLRNPKSLVNTFPFNANGGEADHHHAHGGHHGDHHHTDNRVASESLASRAQRQGSEGGAPSFGDVAGASPGADGKRCIDKVEMVEEIEYDDVVQCDHSYDKRCHTTYVTNYESQQERAQNCQLLIINNLDIFECTLFLCFSINLMAIWSFVCSFLLDKANHQL